MQTSEGVGWRQVVIVSREPANTHANGYLFDSTLLECLILFVFELDAASSHLLLGLLVKHLTMRVRRRDSGHAPNNRLL